jgi:hypothetical protein
MKASCNLQGKGGIPVVCIMSLPQWMRPSLLREYALEQGVVIGGNREDLAGWNKSGCK